jgi:hypothetical protein
LIELHSTGGYVQPESRAVETSGCAELIAAPSLRRAIPVQRAVDPYPFEQRGYRLDVLVGLFLCA